MASRMLQGHTAQLQHRKWVGRAAVWRAPQTGLLTNSSGREYTLRESECRRQIRFRFPEAHPSVEAARKLSSVGALVRYSSRLCGLSYADVLPTDNAQLSPPPPPPPLGGALLSVFPSTAASTAVTATTAVVATAAVTVVVTVAVAAAVAGAGAPSCAWGGDESPVEVAAAAASGVSGCSGGHSYATVHLPMRQLQPRVQYWRSSGLQDRPDRAP